jgi:hypothetical protein
MKTAAIKLTIPNIRLYDIFRKDLNLPDERAHNLVQAIDEAVKGGCEENLKEVATKEFVKDEIRATKEFVKNEIRATKEFVRGEIQVVKNEINRVELKVEQTKSDLTKSIYLTSLIQVLVIVSSIIGIITFIFRK